MNSSATYQQLLSEILTNQLSDAIEKAEPGHCMRIEGLPYEVLDTIGSALQNIVNDAKVVLLSNSPKKSYEVSATKLIELRNTAEDSHPLLVLIPSNLRTAAEDSFDRATFKQIEVGIFPELVVQKLMQDLPDSVKSKFMRIKNFLETTIGNIAYSVWAKYIIACKKEDYAEEFWGKNLYHIRLIPDRSLCSDSDLMEQRLNQNVLAVKTIRDEKQPLVSRISALQIKAETIQKSFYELLSFHAKAEDIAVWGELIAHDTKWQALDLSQWEFLDLRPPQELELFVNPLKGKQITRKTGDSIKRIITKENRDAKVSINFMTQPGPMQVNSLTHFQIDLMRTEDRGLVEKVNTLVKFKKTPSARDSRSKQISVNPAEVAQGTYFFRVLALDAAGVTLNRNDAFQDPVLQEEWEHRQKENPESANRDDLYGKLTCDSEDFIFEIEAQEPDDEEDAEQSLGRRQKAASLLQATVKIHQDYLKGKQIKDIKSINVEDSFWIDQAKGKAKECTLEVHFNDVRHHYIIPMATSLRNISIQILKKPERLGTFRVDYKPSSITAVGEVHLRDNRLAESAPKGFLKIRANLFQSIINNVKDDSGNGVGVVESCDFVSIAEQIELYLAAYDQWMSELIARVEDKIDEAFSEEIRKLQLLDHIELIVPSPTGHRENILLLSPLHPLKLAWFLQFQRFYLHLEETSLTEPSPSDLWPTEMQKLFLGELTPSNHPLVIHGANLRSYYYAGDVAPGWSGYLPVSSLDPMNEGKNIDRAWFDQIQDLLGIPTTLKDLVGYSHISLYRQIRRYLVQHPYIDILHLNIFNPGDGRKLVECLKLLQSESIFAKLRYEIRLFTTTDQLKSAGTVFDEFLNPSRNVSEEADAFLIPSENALFPKIRFSRGTIQEYQKEPENYAAHLSFMIEVLPVNVHLGKTEQFNQPSVFCFGLLVNPVSGLVMSDKSIIGWSHSLNVNLTAPISDDDSLTAMLTNALEKNQQIVALSLAGRWTNDIPSLSLSLSDEQKALLYQTHQNSDWVITIDQNMGVDFYDTPSDGDYIPYLLDYSPGSSTEKIPLFVTTRPASEILGLFIPHLKKYNLLPNDELPPVFRFLELLRSISGAIIMQSISSPTKALETIGMGLSRMLIERLGVLDDQFIIPLDPHHDIFEEIVKTSTDSMASAQRADFLIVSIDVPSETIHINALEVKCRQKIGSGDALNSLKMKMNDQLENTVSGLQYHFDPSFKIPDRLDRPLKNKQFCELLIFYLERANRYGLVSTEIFEQNLKYLNRLNDHYKLLFDKIGLIFEFEGDQAEIVHMQEAGDLSYFHVGQKMIQELFKSFTKDPDTKDSFVKKELTEDLMTLRSVITKYKRTVPRKASFKETSKPEEKPKIIETDPARTTEIKKVTDEKEEVPKKSSIKSDSNKSAAAHYYKGDKAAPDMKKVDHSPLATASAEGQQEPPEFSHLIGDTENSPQYGILGMAPSNRVLALDLNGCNTISLFGVPGAGKSYSLGTVVEMAVKPIQGINHLPSPLASVIFHFHESEDYPPEFISMRHENSNSQEIELLGKIYNAKPDSIDDIVLLSPIDKIEERKVQYPEITVAPIAFSSKELSIKDWKFLMGAMGNQAMYIQHLNMIMRRGRNNLSLNYIKQAVDNSGLSDSQKDYAHNRLELAEQFIDDETNLRQYLKPGRIVIVDLRDEFIEKDQALGLFIVMLNIFAGTRNDDGSVFNKLIVFDEAHKYITHSDLTSHVVEVIRQMRHQGVTMLIASQDPLSLPNAVIELSSAIILHRFNSPAWLRHVQKSVVALNDLTASQLAALQPGEAYIWSNKATHPDWTKKAIKVMTRPRVTLHGGSTQKAVK